MNNLKSGYILICVLMLISVIEVQGQNAIPEVLNKSSIKEQMLFIEERTRIYENYRAIREDMFQKLITNISDTISVSKSRIEGLNNSISALNTRIDSLGNSLMTTKSALEETTRTKNSIRVLGIEINKVAYNALMWIIVAALLSILGIGFLIFKRNLSVFTSTKSELKTLQEEFDAYRKTTREAREKMSMDHFKEVQRLKGKG